jgi:predicted transposase/invertase (TIGR01784 family)
MKTYKKSLVTYNDIELVTECSLQEGHRKGRQEGHREGLQEGLQKGHRKGRQEERLLVAANFLRLGLSIEEIAKGTGLSPEQIRRLK